jgi:hypothetical protein
LLLWKRVTFGASAAAVPVAEPVPEVGLDEAAAAAAVVDFRPGVVVAEEDADKRGEPVTVWVSVVEKVVSVVVDWIVETVALAGWTEVALG